MSLKRAGLLVQALILVASLAACGFTPVYAPNSKTAAALSDITLDAPRNDHSYIFVREMEQRIGRTTDGSKRLKYRIIIRGEGVESDSERRRFVGTATYELIDKRKKKTIASGVVESFAGYSVSNGLFDSARRDAAERLVVILAELVTRELIGHLAKPR